MSDKGQGVAKKRRSLPNSFHYTVMMVPGFVWLLLFSIVPMVGIIMAFQNFNPGKGIFGSDWVGMDNFVYLTRLGNVPEIIRNTLVIAIGKLVLNIVVPLVFAQLLNECRNM